MAENKNIEKREKNRITRETLVFFLKLACRKKPSLIVLYVIKIIAGFGFGINGVIMTKFIMDSAAALISGTGDIKDAAMYAGIYIGLQLLFNATGNIVNIGISLAREWFEEYIDVEISDRAMAMDFEHTEDPAVLDVLEKAKEGMSWYSGGVCGILNAFSHLIDQTVLLCSVSVLILLTCPLLLPVQVISLAVISVFNKKNNDIEKASFLELAKSNRVFGYVLYELADFRLGKDIRLYESADMMCKKAEEFSDRQSEEWISKDRKTCKNSWIMDVVNALRDGASYFYIGFLAVTRVISIGDFSMCIAGSSTFYWSLHAIITGLQDISKKCSYAHKYIEFMEYPAAMESGDKKPGSGTHVIEFKNVSFKYPRSEEWVLRNVSLKINSGEHLSVVGLNGAGKTTFIKLLCRLYDTTEGEILIDGVNIREYDMEEYRRLFAVVFQDFQLFAFSLRENIALCGEADDDRITEVMKQSGLYEDAQKLEKGLDTMLYKSFDEKGTELSGGQKQKTAISRALYRDAPIVILDEPTAALDPVAEYDIYRSFDGLVGGKTAIYISHRLSSCKFCDRIAVFSDCTVKEYGTHEELAALPGGLYAQMFAAQAKYYLEAGK